MIELDLVNSVSTIGRRSRHPIMDTDKERNQEYYFTMTFRSRQQCDQAVNYIQTGNRSSDSSVEQDLDHHFVGLNITDAIFTCWEDI